MIANINPVGRTEVGNVIVYHEKKVNELNASYGETNLIPVELKQKIEAFELQSMLNNNVNTGIYHIDIDFDINDSLTLELQQQLVEEWMTHMGFDNRLYLTYHHHDKPYEHLHIIVSNLDWEGKRWDDEFFKFKNLKLCRKLERKYGLRELSEETTKYKLNREEAAIEKYQFPRALRKAISNNDIEIMSLLEDKIIEHDWLDQNLDTQQIRYFFEKKDRIQQYRDIFSYLNDNGYVTRSIKQKLRTSLTQIKKQSKTLEEFLESANQQGIYARMLNTSKGVIIKYGAPDHSYYMNDETLDSGFTLKSLVSYYETDQKRSLESLHKMIIKSKCEAALNESTHIDNLTEQLQQDNIQLIKHSNSRGVYGYSFKIGEFEYKASQVHRSLSFAKINDRISSNQQKAEDMRTCLGSVQKIMTNKGTINIKELNDHLTSQNIRLYYNRKKCTYDLIHKLPEKTYIHRYTQLKDLASFKHLTSIFKSNYEKQFRINKIAKGIRKIGFQAGKLSQLYAQMANESEYLQAIERDL